MSKTPALFLQNYIPVKYEYYECNPKNLYKPEKKVKGHYDCIVRSFCKVSGLGWSKVYQMLVDESWKKFDMPDAVSVSHAVARKLGFKHKKLISTVAAFICAHPKGTYVICIFGHMFPYIDGVIYDNVDGKAMDDYDINAMLLESIQFVYYKETLNLQ